MSCTNPGHAALSRHRRAGESPCDACRTWRAGWDAARRPKTRKQAECGTKSGATRHRRNGEDVCDACLKAETEARAKYRRSRDA